MGFADVCVFFFSFLVVVGLMSVGEVGFVTNVVVEVVVGLISVGMIGFVTDVVVVVGVVVVEVVINGGGGGEREVRVVRGLKVERES